MSIRPQVVASDVSGLDLFWGLGDFSPRNTPKTSESRDAPGGGRGGRSAAWDGARTSASVYDVLRRSATWK